MNVTLLHNYREREQYSMWLYADRLGTSLKEIDVCVHHYRPRPLLPSARINPRFIRKVDSYLGRFFFYPARMQCIKGDVFHIVDHGQAYLLAVMDHRKVVVTCHDLMLLLVRKGVLRDPNSSSIATRIFEFAIKQLAKAAHVIVVSESTRRDLLEVCEIDPERVSTIYSGLNYKFNLLTDEERDNYRRQLGLSGSLIAHVGGNYFYKNLEGVLHVLARLRAGGIEAGLVRAGQKLTATQLKLADRLGVTPFIKDLGMVDQRTLNLVYGAADLFLFPSLYEGFGWPALEAMATGLPVLASNAGSLPELIGDAGILCDPYDLDCLSEMSAKVLTDAEYANRLRVAGLSRSKIFTWEKTARQSLTVYEKVYGQRS